MQPQHQEKNTVNLYSGNAVLEVPVRDISALRDSVCIRKRFKKQHLCGEKCICSDDTDKVQES